MWVGVERVPCLALACVLADVSAPETAGNVVRANTLLSLLLGTLSVCVVTMLRLY